MSFELTESYLRDALAERAGSPPAAPDALDTIRRRAGQIRRRRRRALGAGAAAAAGALAVALLSGPLASNQARVDVGDVATTRPPTSTDAGPVLPPRPADDPGESPAPPDTTSRDPAGSDDSGEPDAPPPDPSSDEPSPAEPSTPETSTPSSPGTTTSGASTTTTSTPTSVGCGDIVFSPSSDEMATGIVATGVTCTEATALVRTVRDQHNFVSGPRSFTAAGWACTVVTEDVSIPVGHYSCARGDAEVTWDRT
jgi:hypothetical protein